MRKQYILEELDCAHCAMEMEEAARKIPGVQFVSVNFLSMRLTLEAADEDYERVFRQVVKACRRVEPDCRILTKKYRMGGEEKKELIRIVAAAGLFLVVKLLEVFGVLEEGHWLTLLLYLPAYALAGYEVVWKALRGLFRGRVFDENFLMTLATVGAVATGEYSEAVAVMVLYQIGEFLQDLAVSKSRRSVTELMDIRPDSAHLLKDGREMTVKPEDVPVGSLIVIRPGEKVPLDGEVVEGRSFLDTTALTGESVPREILAGQKITSGCVNMRGVLTVKTEKSFGESSVSRILALIEDGADTKSHAEKFISRFAKWYTPVV
ncbi:MAG: heavy metal translocating P-type ATPase, partial [Clostridia bacterium]|nr:heavy metal translocating P-type ATPase [Clostridia bacterium]